MKKVDELDNLIELFFFDPRRRRDDYIDLYKKVYPDRYSRENGYRYSPLYLVLKDVRYCFCVGREFNQIRGKLDPANFAAVILIDLAFSNLVQRVFSGDYDGFAQKYMGVTSSSDRKALRLLRNALEHSFYSLYIRENGIKYYFSLGYYETVVRKNPQWKRSYPSELYEVNPLKLFSAFTDGLRKFKDDLLDRRNAEMRRIFKEKTDADNWIYLPNPPLP